MFDRLSGKTAIVTGGGSGLGRGLAEALASYGVNVVITSRRMEVLQAEALRINQHLGVERVFPVVCDVSDSASVKEAVRQAEDVLGQVDILINNSGLAIADLVEDCKEEDWDTVLNTNVKGTFLMSQAVLRGMLSRETGFILNIASQAAKRGYANVASYCASKFAILGFADALGKEVKDRGVRVHCLNPGLFQVPEPDSEDDLNPSILQVSDVVESALFALTRPQHVKLEDQGLYNLFDADV